MALPKTPPPNAFVRQAPGVRQAYDMVLPPEIGHTAMEFVNMRHVGYSIHMVQHDRSTAFELRNLFAIGLLASCLAACSVPATYAAPPSRIAPTRGPTPTNNIQPPATVVPASGPTLAASAQVALNFLNGLPNQIGRFTLAKNPDDPTMPKMNYVATDTKTGSIVGAVATYQVNDKNLVIALWLTANTNYALDRYNFQAGYTTVPMYPVEVGDQAIVAPANKAFDNFIGMNPPIWGLLRFRNILVDVYPTKNLTDAYSDVTQAELGQVLQAIFGALPK